MSFQEKMQHDHREWNREHVYWLEDLDRWREERHEALDTVRALEGVLSYPEAAWEQHREKMVALEQELARHQHHLQSDGADTAQEQENHEASRRRQEEERAQHARLKARQEAVMQHLRELRALLADA